MTKPVLGNLSVVACCYNYGRYLEEWAGALIALNTYPAAVCIVDAGSTDDTPREIRRAARRLREAGMKVRVKRIDRCNLGKARNAAVALADTEWVQHLDVDDLAMPHMLDDVAELMPVADVVAIGYQRFGENTRSGPNLRIYRDSQGETTLRSTAPAAATSPFRKALWEKRPYLEDLHSGWDTALWIGFAHMNARFVATKRPCYLYRQHADSLFNTRRLQARTNDLVASRFNSLRRGDAGVSVIVPLLLNGDRYRERIWEWMRQRWAARYPDWELIIGTSQGEWRKGVALNAGVQASHGDVLVIADADCWVDEGSLRHAVELVGSGAAPWVVPQDMLYRLDADATESILASDPTGAVNWAGGTIKAPYRCYAGGGTFVVRRAIWDHVRGFPEVFRGWGKEDETMAVILDTLAGEHVRLETPIWHLYHHASRRAQGQDWQNNCNLYSKYVSAARQGPDVLWDMLCGKTKNTQLVDTYPYKHRPTNPIHISSLDPEAFAMLASGGMTAELEERLRSQAEERTRLLEQERERVIQFNMNSYEERRLAKIGRRLGY